VAKKINKSLQRGEVKDIILSTKLLQNKLNEISAHGTSIEQIWKFDLAQYIDSGSLSEEIISVGKIAGLNIVKRDNRLYSYPSMLKISPKDTAVYINRKRMSTIRPSQIVEFLKVQSNRKATYKPIVFLEALFKCYTYILETHR
jgi:hypothetical protein